MSQAVINYLGRFVNPEGTKLEVEITDATINIAGSNMELRGTAATKPLATAVTIGATYWSVDIDPHGDAIEVSTGAGWVVI